MSGKVVALPGTDRPEDSQGFLAERLAAGVRAVVVVTFEENGNMELRFCGRPGRYELAMLGATLSHEAVAG